MGSVVAMMSLTCADVIFRPLDRSIMVILISFPEIALLLPSLLD